jgi:hypothetical protein
MIPRPAHLRFKCNATPTKNTPNQLHQSRRSHIRGLWLIPFCVFHWTIILVFLVVVIVILMRPMLRSTGPSPNLESAIVWHMLHECFTCVGHQSMEFQTPIYGVSGNDFFLHRSELYDMCCRVSYKCQTLTRVEHHDTPNHKGVCFID